MMDLTGNTYIVTGASRGFGLAITQALLEVGANVGMIARNNEHLQHTVAQLNSGQVVGIAGDVADTEQMRAAFSRIKDHFGGLNGLVNNAGLARPGDVENLRLEDVQLQLNTNFVGTVFCCQAAIPLLRGQDNPRIINMSSASAWHYDEMRHLSIYAATKAAVERFTRDLHLELQATGIGVSCIRPGGADTSFAEDWDMDRLMAGVAAWQDSGPTMNTGMGVRQIADAVLYCLAAPQGVAVDLLEVRPNTPTEKLKL
jgi:NAD(P)-dependent dehydrogenase (short-subunit alcohol dehydrogenase family)